MTNYHRYNKFTQDLMLNMREGSVTCNAFPHAFTWIEFPLCGTGRWNFRRGTSGQTVRGNSPAGKVRLQRESAAVSFRNVGLNWSDSW